MNKNLDKLNSKLKYLEIKLREQDGKTWELALRKNPHTVTIIPVTTNNELILVSQYRAGVDKYTLEFPAGMCDIAGEFPYNTAARELYEETGYRHGAISEVTERLAVSGGFTNETSQLFIALNCQSTPASPEKGIKVHFFKLKKNILKTLADIESECLFNDYILDARVLAGLCLLK